VLCCRVVSSRVECVELEWSGVEWSLVVVVFVFLLLYMCMCVCVCVCDNGSFRLAAPFYTCIQHPVLPGCACFRALPGILMGQGNVVC